MHLIGIDEVGRGALAGPVVVAAVAIKPKMKFRKLADSKHLTPLQREKWFEFIKNNPKIIFAAAKVFPKVIDRINISQAANLAAFRVFKRLNIKKAKIFLDGGLFIKNRVYQKNLNAETIIKGDQKIAAIKLASIVAKVIRDNLMCRMGQCYREYGLEIHKGYGTKVHNKAIKKNGLTEIHRRSFCHI